ncbi:signal recognition particle receptor beta subunit-domain-containing protein [Geopyxis carbonaria]|nr:signal recognition particle receptor beta subunit-domain-containing protein [Geopyxis carbonaria]
MTFLNPSPVLAITIALCIFSLPLVLHFFIFRSDSRTHLPIYLLLGPAGTGKTAIMTSFASPGSLPETRTSQAPLSLPASIPATLSASSKFRSTSDTSLSSHLPFLLQDSPGHGKLRPLALDLLTTPDIRGLIFVCDANSADFRDTAEFLYSALLTVQRLQEKRERAGKEFRVLVACNKSDLFTALPATKVRALLEGEMGKVADARSRGIVGVGKEEEEGEEVLGGSGEGFKFDELEEAGVVVEFVGGCVKDDGWRVKLGEWVGKSLS